MAQGTRNRHYISKAGSMPAYILDKVTLTSIESIADVMIKAQLAKVNR
jgi:hypothetical protein